ncbi:hypothetical protein Tco_1388828 [Tanacetum coccineum]
MRLVTHGLEEYEFENNYNNGKNLSEIQLEHEKEDELVAVAVKVVHELDCMMVVKEIENGLLEEVERSLDGGLSKTLVVRMRIDMYEYSKYRKKTVKAGQTRIRERK